MLLPFPGADPEERSRTAISGVARAGELQEPAQLGGALAQCALGVLAGREPDVHLAVADRQHDPDLAERLGLELEPDPVGAVAGGDQAGHLREDLAG